MTRLVRTKTKRAFGPGGGGGKRIEYITMTKSTGDIHRHTYVVYVKQSKDPTLATTLPVPS